MPAPATIIIADDHVTYRTGLRDVLTNAGYRVVAVVDNGLQLVEATQQLQPDIVFIDIRMPEMDGVAACTLLHSLYPAMGKIAITFYDPCHPDVHKMWKAGARGFLWKTADVNEIIHCTEAALQRHIYFDASCQPVFNTLLDGNGKHNLPEKMENLLRLIGKGFTTRQIAHILHKSPHTIEAWREKLMRLCGVKTFADLMKFGVRHGIIEL